MIQILLYIATLALLPGCASQMTEYNQLSIDNQRWNRVISSTNDNIRGSYGRDNKFDFSKFDQAAYEHYLEASTSKTAVEMKSFYSDLSVRDFTAFKHTFVFCGFSKKEKLAFCDDPACGRVESITTTNTPNFSDLKKDLPLKECK